MPVVREATSEEIQHACNTASAERSHVFETLALDALRTAGLRLTMPRIQVIRALGESNRPLTANEIHTNIGASGGRIDSVSVYRILSTLQAIGAVHRIGVVDAFYACGLHSEQAHDTQHFVCESCGCVIEVDLPSTATESVSSEAVKVGFRPSEIRLEVLGKCEHCQAS